MEADHVVGEPRAPSPDGGRVASPQRSWFVASDLPRRVESLERIIDIIQQTSMVTLPRDVQDIRMSVADIVSRQNAVENLVTSNHTSVAEQLYSLAEVVDEHSNSLREAPDRATEHGSLERFGLSPEKTNKDLERMIDAIT